VQPHKAIARAHTQLLEKLPLALLPRQPRVHLSRALEDTRVPPLLDVPLLGAQLQEKGIDLLKYILHFNCPGESWVIQLLKPGTPSGVIYFGWRFAVVNPRSGIKVLKKRRSTSRKRVRQWPPDLATPYVPVPIVFLENLGNLGLSPTEALLVIALKLFQGREEEVAWPAVETLARMLGVHARTIQRALSSLEHKKLVRRDDQPRKAKTRKTNEYRLDGLDDRLRVYLTNKEDVPSPISAMPAEEGSCGSSAEGDIPF
jgi:hypothetical protein